MQVASDVFDTAGIFQPGIEASPNGLLVLDPAGTIAFVNEALEALFGHRRDELIGHGVDRILPGMTASIHAFLHGDAARVPHAGRLADGRALRGRHKDGSDIPVDVRVKPLQTSDGLFVLASIVDVGAREDDLRDVFLRREERDRLKLTRVVGQSVAIRRVLEQIQQVAGTESTVLLLGETGTGKELFATQIHEMGTRRARPMVTVNCAAIPATLIENELFGREKGAYTGALARQVGRFELADRSTIFLDEIGDLPPDVQVKLLRVLEERQIERLGSPRAIAVDTRIIAATHRNLEERIAEGAFRDDLYYRLNVFPIRVPPLRERVEDIPLLVWRFVDEYAKAFGRRIDTIDKDSLLAMQQYTWPGNIRELRNVVERAMIVATTRRLTITVPQTSAVASRRSSKLIDVETEHIRMVLDSTAWRIRGVGGAADRLGLKPTTLETRLAKLGLKRPGHP
jgi:formate hydrogenlyase transcriptional activator